MGINDDDDDDETDKIPTHHLEFCLLGFCPLGLILHTIMIMVMILMMMMMIRGMILVVMTIMIMIDKDAMLIRCLCHHSLFNTITQAITQMRHSHRVEPLEIVI